MFELSALLADGFDDETLPIDWTFERGTWSESDSRMAGVPDDDVGEKIKARAIADGTAACDNCRVRALLSSSDGFGGPAKIHARLLAWYTNRGKNFAVTLKPEQDKIVYREKRSEEVVNKVTVDWDLEEGVVYEIEMVFDGRDMWAFLDGALVFQERADAPAPFGSVGVQSRNSTIHVHEILVDGEARELAKLTSPRGQDGGRFGASVSVDGEEIVVGASHEGVPELCLPDERFCGAIGVIYRYERVAETGDWQLTSQYTSGLLDSGDQLGESVAISEGMIFGGTDALSFSFPATYVFLSDAQPHPHLAPNGACPGTLTPEIVDLSPKRSRRAVVGQGDRGDRPGRRPLRGRRAAAGGPGPADLSYG